METGGQNAGGVLLWGPSNAGLVFNQSGRFDIQNGRWVDGQDQHTKCLPALRVFDSSLSNPFKLLSPRRKEERSEEDPAGPAPVVLLRLEFRRGELSYPSLTTLPPPRSWPGHHQAVCQLRGRRPSLLTDLTPRATLRAAPCQRLRARLTDAEGPR